jgi:hypothetical protein
MTTLEVLVLKKDELHHSIKRLQLSIDDMHFELADTSDSDLKNELCDTMKDLAIVRQEYLMVSYELREISQRPLK